QASQRADRVRDVLDDVPEDDEVERSFDQAEVVALDDVEPLGAGDLDGPLARFEADRVPAALLHCQEEIAHATAEFQAAADAACAPTDQRGSATEPYVPQVEIERAPARTRLSAESLVGRV